MMVFDQVNQPLPHNYAQTAAAGKGKAKAKATATGVPRKPLGEDSECGVCFEALVEGARAEGMSYCNVCGNSLHTAWYVTHTHTAFPLLYRRH